MNILLLSAANNVDRSLKPAEAATVDAAIASTRLLLTMLEQHDAAGVHSAIALEAIRHAHRAVTSSVEAREAHIRTHGALNTDLKRVGLEERFSKDSNPPPNEDFSWTLVPRGARTAEMVD